MALILGTELTEGCLLSTFDLFLKDLDQVCRGSLVRPCSMFFSCACHSPSCRALLQVKAGVVRHLGKFLSVLSPATRETYITTVEDIQSESVNWRFRKLIAKYACPHSSRELFSCAHSPSLLRTRNRQLADIAALYPESTIRKNILPISLRLCRDQVSRVRDAANSKVPLLINHLVSRQDEQLLAEYIEQLLALATHKSCMERQTYVELELEHEHKYEYGFAHRPFVLVAPPPV